MSQQRQAFQLGRQRDLWRTVELPGEAQIEDARAARRQGADELQLASQGQPHLRCIGGAAGQRCGRAGGTPCWRRIASREPSGRAHPARGTATQSPPPAWARSLPIQRYRCGTSPRRPPEARGRWPPGRCCTGQAAAGSRRREQGRSEANPVRIYRSHCSSCSVRRAQTSGGRSRRRSVRWGPPECERDMAAAAVGISRGRLKVGEGWEGLWACGRAPASWGGGGAAAPSMRVGRHESRSPHAPLPHPILPVCDPQAPDREAH